MGFAIMVFSIMDFWKSLLVIEESLLIFTIGFEGLRYRQYVIL